MNERCEQSGKVCLKKRDAETRRNRLNKRGRGKLRIYQCDTCPWWHLTNDEKKLRFNMGKL